MSDPERLDSAAAIRYWDERHREQGELLSGGDNSYDHAANEAFYAIRLGRLLDIIAPVSSPAAPTRVLDAGCGKGWFSRALARCGFLVDGIDSSAHAIAECRTAAVATETYVHVPLDSWAPPHLYDVVAAIDVLFHLTEDDVWERSVRNLAALTKMGGHLVIADHDHAGSHVWGNYQVTRGADLYRAVVEPLGLSYQGFSPYRFRDNLGGFHTFKRES